MIKNAELTGKSTLTINSLKQINNQLKIEATKIRQVVDTQIKLTVNNGVDITNKINVDYMTDIIDDLEITKITKIGVRNTFLSINTKVIESLVNRIFTDGYKFSDRVWKVGENYQNQIKEIISAGMAQGRSTLAIAKDIQVYTKDGKIALVNRFGKLERGTATFINRIGNRIDSRAIRLVSSELYMSLQDAAKEQGLLNPGALNLYDWVLELGRRSWNCECPNIANDSPYTYERVPAYPHPRCRCNVRPILRPLSELKIDLKSWINGNKIDYLDTWYDKYYVA